MEEAAEDKVIEGMAADVVTGEEAGAEVREDVEGAGVEVDDDVHLTNFLRP